MRKRGRPWQLLVFGIGLAICAALWFFVKPQAPDLADRGFTAIRCTFMRYPNPPATASSADPAVVAAVTDALRAGRSAADCKCADIASLELVHPNGSAEVIDFVPAHADGTVEFRYRRERYQMSSAEFLRAVEPLGVPAERWTGSLRE